MTVPSTVSSVNAERAAGMSREVILRFGREEHERLANDETATRKELQSEEVMPDQILLIQASSSKKDIARNMFRSNLKYEVNSRAQRPVSRTSSSCFRQSLHAPSHSTIRPVGLISGYFLVY